MRKLRSGPWQRRASGDLGSSELSSGRSNSICEPVSCLNDMQRPRDECSVAGRAQEVHLPPWPLPGCLILGKSLHSRSSAACSIKCEQYSQGSRENEVRRADGRTTQALVMTVMVPVLRLAQSPFLRAQPSGQNSPDTCFAPQSLFSFLY